MIIYGRITGQTADAWLFRPAFVLDRDPPLGEVVRVRKRDARRGRPLMWANLDALHVRPVSERPDDVNARKVPDEPARRVWYGDDCENVPLFSAAGRAVD